MFDIRLKENFKLFISGPSRCGKTFFVSELLENIESFAKEPPETVVYVYKVWQRIFVIFDDLINSKSLVDIATLFAVDGRHMNMSMAFLSKRMFVNNEYFRQISQNCDYFCVFKNPRNSSEIRALAQQLTPGSLDLIEIYKEATKSPFSYLFINLTQECNIKVKYLSHLFNDNHSVQVYQLKEV